MALLDGSRDPSEESYKYPDTRDRCIPERFQLLVVSEKALKEKLPMFGE